MSDTLTPDLRFAIVPEWVVDAQLSDKAFRLYTILAVHADFNSGHSTPGRKLLAERMGCSIDTVDRAKKELVRVGALTVKPRTTPRGDPTSNVYVLHREPPSRRAAATRTGAGSPHASGDLSRTGAATKMNENHVNENGPPPPAWNGPKTVNGKRVTRDEVASATSILDSFNEVSGRRFAGKEWLAKIVLRLREHPELALRRHREIIREQFEHPWWTGDPTPSVVYGNGAVFDRALNGVRGAPASTNGADPWDGVDLSYLEGPPAA
jgi:hypothetical protein